jgi:hypothetical protein
MRVLVSWKVSAQLARPRDKRASHIGFFPGLAVDLLECTYNQSTNRGAGTLRPVPQPFVQRLGNVNGSPNCHDFDMS